MPIPLRLALISEGFNTWPLYVAQERGLFTAAGVDVDLTVTGSSVEQLKDLVAGRYDVGLQQSDHVVRAVEQGSDLFIFMAMGHAPDLSLVVAPQIRNFADLKGQAVGVDGARTGYALLLRKLLAERGLTEKDWQCVEIGGSKERSDALQSGRAVASLLNPPFDTELFAKGFGSLGAINDFFPTYPGSIAAARRSWAAANADTLVAFIRGFTAAQDWLLDPANREAAVALFPARLKMSSAAVAKAFDAQLTRGRPAVTAAGLRQVIEVTWPAEGYAGAPAAPEKYMDLQYLQRAAGSHS